MVQNKVYTTSRSASTLLTRHHHTDDVLQKLRFLWTFVQSQNQIDDLQGIQDIYLSVTITIVERSVTVGRPFLFRSGNNDLQCDVYGQEDIEDIEGTIPGGIALEGAGRCGDFVDRSIKGAEVKLIVLIHAKRRDIETRIEKLSVNGRILPIILQ